MLHSVYCFQVYTLWLKKCTWFKNNNLDVQFKFCHYLLSKTKCWIICSHSKFWNHFQKQIWVDGLGFCLEGRGKHHNRPNWSISYHTTICFNTFHTWIYVKTILGKIGHSKGYRSSKSFILVVANGLGPKDMHALSFFPKFYK